MLHRVTDFNGILRCGTLRDKLNSAHFKGRWETDEVLQSCEVTERLKKRKQVINSLKTGLLSPCEQSVFVSIPVARRCSLHIEKPEVSTFASQPGRLLMFVLTATAQPVHLHPIEKKCETEWETMVPLWDKLKGLCNHRKKRVQRKRLCFTVSLLQLLYLVCITTKAPSPLTSGALVLGSIN